MSSCRATNANECGHGDECDCFDPANVEPTAFEWVECDDPSRRYGTQG